MNLRQSLYHATLACAILSGTLSPARAELTKLIESSRGTAVYVDPASIARDSDLRKVNEMWDFREPDQFGNFSTRVEAEYDCVAGARRILSVTGYPAQKWQGKPAPPMTTQGPAWKPVSPNTLAAAIMRGVCLK